MIPIIEDKISNFVSVKHAATGNKFLMHKSQVEIIGKAEKVQVYALPITEFIPPNSQYPKGKYLARAKFFVASYLTLV